MPAVPVAPIRRRPARAAVIAVVSVLVAGACGSDAATPPGPAAPPTGAVTTGDVDPGRFPPATGAELAAIFDPLLEPLGLRFARGSLIAPERGVYEPVADGTHLAVYVEPTGAYTTADYATGLVEVARVFLPLVFERWEGLASFDVCQEPPPAVDDSAAPPSVTIIDLTRDQAAAVDWSDLDLAGLLAAADGLRRVFVSPDVAADPVFVDAARRAGVDPATFTAS